MNLPKIRENLLIQEAGDEVLVYDMATNTSYCLNETAKTVFNACDGKKTFADLNLPEEVIYLSLDELKKNNLIESDYASPFVGMNRRDVIRKVGLASMVALPVISSLIAPSPAAAASSGCPSGFTCVGPGSMYCSGRNGQPTNRIGYNSINGTCTGPQTFSDSIVCNPGFTAGADRCISN